MRMVFRINRKNQQKVAVCGPLLDTQAESIVEEPNSAYGTRIPHVVPDYGILVGKNSLGGQFWMLGKSIHSKKIAIDLSDTNTISLFGVQGGGKSYTIGTIKEVILKQFSHTNKLPSPIGEEQREPGR